MIGGRAGRGMCLRWLARGVVGGLERRDAQPACRSVARRASRGGLRWPSCWVGVRRPIAGQGCSSRPSSGEETGQPT